MSSAKRVKWILGLRPLIVVGLLFLPSLGRSECQAGQQHSHLYTAESALHHPDARMRDLLHKYATSTNEVRAAYFTGAQGPDTVGVIMYSLDHFFSRSRRVGEESHYTRTGTLCVNLIRAAQTPVQRAYALGWASHYLNDQQVHAVVNEHGGFYAEQGDWHKALEMLETTHVLSRHADVVDDRLATLHLTEGEFLDSGLGGFVFDVYRGLYGPADRRYDPQHKTVFAKRLAFAVRIGRLSLRDFNNAHVSKSGKHSSQLTQFLAIPRMPSTAEYDRIMEDLKILDVREHAKELVVDVAVSDNMGYRRFLKDWEPRTRTSIEKTREMLCAACGYWEAPEGSSARKEHRRVLALRFLDISLDAPEGEPKNPFPAWTPISDIRWACTTRAVDGSIVGVLRGAHSIASTAVVESVVGIGSLFGPLRSNKLPNRGYSPFDERYKRPSLSGIETLSIPIPAGAATYDLRVAVSREGAAVFGKAYYRGSDWTEQSGVLLGLPDVDINLAYRPAGQGLALPVRGARVILTGKDGAALSTIERATGSRRSPEALYGAKDVYAGTYRVAIKADGFKPVTKTLSVPFTLDARGVVEDVIQQYDLEPAGLLLHGPTFKKASAQGSSRVTLWVETLGEKLRGQSVKLFIGREQVKGVVVRPALDGRSLKISYEFPLPLLPVLHEVRVEVADVNGVQQPPLTASFQYEFGLELTGHELDDAGGAPEDARAHTGETVGIALKLRNFERGPLFDVALVSPTGDPRLWPESKKIWRIESIGAGRAVQSLPLRFKVGSVNGASEVVRLPLAVSVSGQALHDNPRLAVTVWDAIPLAIQLLCVDDSKRLARSNNEDGRADGSESVGLVLHFKNLSDQRLEPFSLRLSCKSSAIRVDTSPHPGLALGKQGACEIVVPAKVAALDQITTVALHAHVVMGGGAPKKVRLLLTLYPPPLAIELVDLIVKDPDSGGLAACNDANGVLGTGETASLYVLLKNVGPPLEHVHIALDTRETHPGLAVHLLFPKGEGIAMPTGKTITRRFEIQIPVDYPKRTLDLHIKVVPSFVKNRWHGQRTLPVDDKTPLQGALTLSPGGKAACVPGADLRYTLSLRSKTARERKRTRELGELNLSLWSNDVILSRPQAYDRQTFPPGQVRTYTGTVRIPKSLAKEHFVIVVDCFDALRGGRVYRKHLVFPMGSLATQITVKPVKVHPAGDKWRLFVEVVDEQGSPVRTGSLRVEASYGALSGTPLVLKGGRAEVTWSRAEGASGQALIELNYRGDRAVPGGAGTRYNTCSKSLFLPPEQAQVTEPPKELKPPPSSLLARLQASSRAEFQLQVIGRTERQARRGQGPLQTTSSERLHTLAGPYDRELQDIPFKLQWKNGSFTGSRSLSKEAHPKREIPGSLEIQQHLQGTLSADGQRLKTFTYRYTRKLRSAMKVPIYGEGSAFAPPVITGHQVMWTNQTSEVEFNVADVSLVRGGSSRDLVAMYSVEGPSLKASLAGVRKEERSEDTGSGIVTKQKLSGVRTNEICFFQLSFR